MSDFTIKDGAGKGYRARVNKDNQLETLSISPLLKSFIAQRKSDYYSSFLYSESSFTFTITTTGGYVYYLENQSETDLILTRLIGTVDGTSQFKLVRNVNVGTIGNSDDHVPINTNFGSAKTADVDCKIWDESGDGITGLTGGDMVIPLYVPAGAVLDFSLDDVYVLPKNSNIAIEAKGIGATRELTLIIPFFFYSNDG